MSISELYRAVSTATGPATAKPDPKPLPPGGAKNEFQELLRQETVARPAAPPRSEPAKPLASPSTKLNFSQHAEARIRSRAIAWDGDLERRVSAGIDTALAKGSRETLILADNVAVIANVKSRTVITAMDRTQMKERIFTNIDSTVLV